MKKFYVSSGDLDTILTAKDHHDAALKAIIKKDASNEEYALGELLSVGERGVDEVHDDDVFFHTQNLLDELEAQQPQ